MDTLTVTDVNDFFVHILVEHTDSGNFIASVPELPNCRSEATTRSEVISSVKEKVKTQLENLEVLKLEVTNNPWIEFIGMFKDDDDFKKLAQEIRDEKFVRVSKFKYDKES